MEKQKIIYRLGRLIDEMNHLQRELIREVQEENDETSKMPFGEHIQKKVKDNHGKSKPWDGILREDR